MFYHEDDDGLGSFTLAQVGMKSGTFGGAKILKFGRDYRFTTTAGELIETSREFVSFGLAKLVQKFVNKQLVDTIVVDAHDNFPDIEQMNADAPEEEWGPGLNGHPQGPYSKVLVLKLLDEATMDRFAFVTKSFGGSIAIGDLSDKIKMRRRLQGPRVTPVVSCHSTLFRTRFNPNDRRPHFQPMRWVELGSDQALAKPAEPPKQLGAAEAVTPATTSIVPEAKPIGMPAADPTLRQEVDDKIIF